MTGRAEHAVSGSTGVGPIVGETNAVNKLNSKAKGPHALLAILILSTIVAVAAGPALAETEVSFEFICLDYATAISADSLFVAGNAQVDYEPFRWSESTGRQLLGRASVPVLGVSAGVPGISHDGTRISSTILGHDSTYITMGVWTEGEGWQECIPPVPPDGGLLDNAYGSAWGLSGDGVNLIGLYWRPGQPGGLAHACTWSEDARIIDLGSNGGDSRANGASFDGSVIAGWSADPLTGAWRPAAWVDGRLSILSPPDVIGEAWAVTSDGMVIGGTQFTGDPGIRTAAIWRWNGAGWDSVEFLGTLPGTAAPNGVAVVHGLSADGSVAVGYNSFYGDPFYTTGFIWTEETGIIDVEDFLADNGVTVPAWFDIRSLTAITPDGSAIIGDGVDLDYIAQSFIIRIDDAAGITELHQADVGSPRLSVRSNPGRTEVTLSLHLPSAACVSVSIYSITGRLICNILDGPVPAGGHEVIWKGTDSSGRDVAPGVYVARATVNGSAEFAKMVLTR